MDFSENLSMNPKYEVQEEHFSGKQFCLHCIIVHPGEVKYEYHLSDDTKHDAIFAKAVLQDIFNDRNIKDETVMIKSDNAPTQYKNLHAFHSMQELADEFNITIIRIYGAAGHGKGLIDSMSTFGCKSILRRDIVGQDRWFSKSEEISDYLSLRGESRMRYTTIHPVQLDNERMKKRDGVSIAKCMSKHLFVFKPNSPIITSGEYLCDCEECLQLNFDNCVKIPGLHCDDMEDLETVTLEEDFDECNLDENDNGKQAYMYEFIEPPSTFFIYLFIDISNPDS